MHTKWHIFILVVIPLWTVKGQDNERINMWLKEYIEYSRLAQEEQKDKLNSLDFSSLFLETPTSSIYGIIGENMQRIQIKWISINKDPNQPNNYYVYGKTKVKNNVCEFTGLLTIKTIRLYKEGEYDMPYRSKVNPEKIGVLFCDYTLTENKKDSHTGVFRGICATEFYINEGQLIYNRLRSGADDMTNNQFVGSWTSYSTNSSTICNWGDFRVPDVVGFDCGAAEFVPCDEYIENGWTQFKDGLYNQVTDEQKWWE